MLVGVVTVCFGPSCCRGASSATPAGAPLATRSYLGHLLPESLLYCLDTYGAQVLYKPCIKRDPASISAPVYVIQQHREHHRQSV